MVYENVIKVIARNVKNLLTSSCCFLGLPVISSHGDFVTVVSSEKKTFFPKIISFRPAEILAFSGNFVTLTKCSSFFMLYSFEEICSRKLHFMNSLRVQTVAARFNKQSFDLEFDKFISDRSLSDNKNSGLKTPLLNMQPIKVRPKFKGKL